VYRKYRKYGFSLIEVMIALAVLVFGIYGLLDLFFNSHNLSQRAQARTQALYLAKGKLTELQASGLEPLFDLAEKNNGIFASEFAALPDNQDFEWKWNISNEGLQESTLRLDVVVSSKKFDGTKVNLYSYIFAAEE